MMPSVAELTYYYEVTNTLNLSHAAKNLRISQPSLSRAIQNLEATIGTELLVRHKKGVTLTPAGKKILLQIKPLLENWKNTKLEALASHHEVEGHIKIGSHPTTGLFVHGFIAELLQDYPKLEIEMRHAPSDLITQQVIDLNIDIGIVTNPIQYPDLIIRKLSDTETTFWVSEGGRDIQDINSDNAVLICNPDASQTTAILRKCKAANIHFKRILKVNSLEVIASLTANGCGIGLLPSCITEHLYANRLTRVANVPQVSDELCLIYRKEYLNVQAVKTIVAKIQQWPIKCGGAFIV